MPAKKYSGKLSAEKCAEKSTVLRKEITVLCKDARRKEKRLRCSAKMRGALKKDYGAPQKCKVFCKDVQYSEKMCSAQKNVQIAEMQNKKYI